MKRFLVLALASAVSLTLLPLAAPTAQELAIEQVAGGPDDFLSVRHVRLRGTQREIGKSLAELAREHHGWTPTASRDPESTRQQRDYFETEAPHFLERMRGVADAAGVDVADDTFNLASLSYGFRAPGCTVVYYPPSSTDWGGGVVSRNFDFTTGTFAGTRPGPGEVAAVASPYVIETYPDEGYPTLTICAYDLLGGVVDGINSEGLTIALLADDEVTRRFGLRAAPGRQAGFGVVQVGRHILETCANVDEAKAALRDARLYYTSIPCHYLVADRHGASFVWENTLEMDGGYVFEGEGEPQITTNFMLNLHPDTGDLPADGRLGSFSRFRAIQARIDALGQPVSREFARATNACVAANAPSTSATRAPGRTLWHALYFPEERRMEVSFYLGEGTDAEGAPTIRRTAYAAFQLER